MSGKPIQYPTCGQCNDTKCTHCAFEEVKTDAIINAIDKLRKKRKLTVGGLSFSLRDNDIVMDETPAKRTKTEQICEAMDSFSNLCRNLSNPESIKEFHFGLRVSLTLPVDESVEDDNGQ